MKAFKFDFASFSIGILLAILVLAVVMFSGNIGGLLKGDLTATLNTAPLTPAMSATDLKLAELSTAIDNLKTRVTAVENKNISYTDRINKLISGNKFINMYVCDVLFALNSKIFSLHGSNALANDSLTCKNNLNGVVPAML